MTTKKRRIDMKSLKKTGRNHEIFQKIFELRLQVKSILSARGFLAKQKKTLAPRMGTLQKSIVMCFTALLELPLLTISQNSLLPTIFFSDPSPLKTTCNRHNRSRKLKAAKLRKRGFCLRRLSLCSFKNSKGNVSHLKSTLHVYSLRLT